MKYGFDANRDLSHFAKCLVSKGYSFVCRYYNVNNLSKNLSYPEANFLSAAGLSIVVVWENGFPTGSSYFSYNKGVVDATAAYEYASQTIKQPDFTPIYFAVDYDASESEVDGVISDYFKGVVSVISGSNYLVGVYGSGLVCEKIKAAGYAGYTWLAQSTGWRGSQTYKDYNLRQRAQKTECIEAGSLNGDPNDSPADNEGSFKINDLIGLLNRQEGIIFSRAFDASACDGDPSWDKAPSPSTNPLTKMEFANGLEKDKFGCTRKDSAGKKKFHGGIDIKAAVGTDCFATEDSVVTAIGAGADLGKYVAIKFTKGGKVFGVAYCHLSKHDILSVGDKVTAGTVVGKTGKTGNVGTDEPHLHLEVHSTEWVAYASDVERSAHSLDPNDYIPE